MNRLVWPAVGLAALLLARAAGATDVTDAVPGHAGLSYFDVARLIVPDLAKTDDGASGHKVVPFRHIEGKDMLAPPSDPITLGVAPIQAIAIPGQPNRLLVMVDLGGSDGNVEEAELLGLFDLSGKPTLLDVVEVGNDRWTAIDTAHAPPMLAAGAPLLVVDSGHSNSNESYDEQEMIFLRNGRFQLIDTLFTYNESLCGYDHTQEPTYAIVPAPGPYRSFRLSVRETVKHNDDQCGDDAKIPPASVRAYSGTYVWNAARGRFVTTSAQLKALDAKNTKWLKGS
jgi:hypothetical protein